MTRWGVRLVSSSAGGLDERSLLAVPGNTAIRDLETAPPTYGEKDAAHASLASVEAWSHAVDASACSASISATGPKGPWWSSGQTTRGRRNHRRQQGERRGCRAYATATEPTSRSCRSILICPTPSRRHLSAVGPRGQSRTSYRSMPPAQQARSRFSGYEVRIGRVGIIIKRCRYSPHGFWSWKPFGGKKWTPAMTFPQIRAGIAVILYNAYQCGTTSRMLHEQARAFATQ